MLTPLPLTKLTTQLYPTVPTVVKARDTIFAIGCLAMPMEEARRESLDESRIQKLQRITERTEERARLATGGGEEGGSEASARKLHSCVRWRVGKYIPGVKETHLSFRALTFRSISSPKMFPPLRPSFFLSYYVYFCVRTKREGRESSRGGVGECSRGESSKNSLRQQAR